MKDRRLAPAMLEGFREYLEEEERSGATAKKYLRDVRQFARYADGRRMEKALVLEYKAALEENYAITSANSMLAALNAFLRFAGWEDCCVKPFRVQKKAYCSVEKELTREEYRRLTETAAKRGNERLSLVLQTICATGIRVSELEHITLEAVHRGEAVVSCKGKTRRILLVTCLRKKLLQYAREHRITEGAIFVTRNGRPIDRSNIWREMKALCRQAGVSPVKVFPHNLRHLFARTFYGLEKDIAKLADILGHASIDTTRIYIMTTGAEHRRKLEKLRLVT